MSLTNQVKPTTSLANNTKVDPVTFVNSVSAGLEFLATQALDFLMTEDNDYLITGVGLITNTAKP